jgi:hypothetical protein
MTSQPGMTSWRLASRLTMPFKGMLLTLRSVPQRLALVAHRLPSRADQDFLPFHQCASQRTAPHQYLSGAALSPPVCIHRTLRPKGSVPASYRHWDFPSIPSMRFVAHSASFPTDVKDVGSPSFLILLAKSLLGGLASLYTSVLSRHSASIQADFRLRQQYQ